MRKSILLVLLIAVASTVSLAQQGLVTGPYLVDYFSNNPGPGGVGDQQLRLINFGLNGTPLTSPIGDVCANLYVFDANQEMISCCSCRITPNGLRTISVANNLTNNPVTSVVPVNGDIKIVSTVAGASCTPLSYNGGFADSTVGFGTHLQIVGSSGSTTQTANCTVLSGPTELNGSISCPQFSGSGLSHITLTITGSINGSIALTNNGSTTQTGSGTTASQFSAGALAGFSFSNPIFTASFGTGSATLNGGQTQNFPSLSGTNSIALNNTTVFAPYTGAGTFLIPISTLTGLTISGGGGNFGGQQVTNATATATVTYTGQSSAGPYIIETLVPPANLSDQERDFLPQACQFTRYLGSGKGVCTCGSGS